MAPQTLDAIQRLLNDLEVQKMRNIRLKNALVRRIEIKNINELEPIHEFDYPKNISNANAL